MFNRRGFNRLSFNKIMLPSPVLEIKLLDSAMLPLIEVSHIHVVLEDREALSIGLSDKMRQVTSVSIFKHTALETTTLT